MELDPNNYNAYYNRNNVGGFVASQVIVNTPKPSNKHSIFNFFK